MNRSTGKTIGGDQSITRRLTATLIVTVLVVSLVAVAAMQLVMSQAGLRGLEQKADQTLAYLVGTLEMPLWTIDADGIKLIGKAAARDEALVRLTISDESGAVVYAMEKDRGGGGKLLNRTAEIFHQQGTARNPVGSVSISLTKAIYQASNRGLLVFSLLIVIPILISIAAVTAIYIRNSLNTPLTRLNEITNRFAEGRYDTSSLSLPYREFQPFDKALAQMAATIEGQIKRVQEAEAKYRDIFANAMEGIFQTTLAGCILNSNPAMAAILGYNSPEELAACANRLGDSVYVKSGERDSVVALLGERGWLANHELQFRRKDQQVIWVSVSAHLIRDKAGAPLLIEGSLTDISARKEAEAQIQHLKNYLANIINSMPSVLVGLDNDQVVTQWNNQAEQSTGIPAAEAVGQPIAKLFPEFTPWIGAMRDELKRQRTGSMEKLLIERRGERHFYDLMLYPLVTNGMEGAVLRIEDVTERARVQEMLVQAEKMMSVGGLAAGMAHEINNPLGIILQSVQNIKRRVSPDFPANLKAAEELDISVARVHAYLGKRQILEFIDNIHEASARAAKIVANMLQFSRRSASSMQPSSLAALMEQALELAASDYDLKRKFDFRSIEVVRDFPPDMPKVPVVPVEIEQVMLNLLKNAAQAMSTGHQHGKPRITLRLRHEERYALLEVEDNGLGMTEEVRRRVFEPFFTTKSPGAGTGLGLSVSYMLVTQRHNGMLEVTSSPGKGSCFKMRLPLSNQDDGADGEGMA